MWHPLVLWGKCDRSDPLNPSDTAEEKEEISRILSRNGNPGHNMVSVNTVVVRGFSLATENPEIIFLNNFLTWKVCMVWMWLKCVPYYMRLFLGGDVTQVSNDSTKVQFSKLVSLLELSMAMRVRDQALKHRQFKDSFSTKAHCVCVMAYGSRRPGSLHILWWQLHWPEKLFQDAWVVQEPPLPLFSSSIFSASITLRRSLVNLVGF